jgi:translocation and assembly module TamB
MAKYQYKFDINAKDFFLIDAQQDENELYFGQGYFDAKMKLIGQNLDFKLTGNVNVGPNTDLTLLLADDSKLGTELETIVQFVDFKDLLNTKKKTITKKPKLSFANAVNINLEVTEKAKLNILMDQVTGDLMKVKGNGKMNIGFDNKGDLFIIGKYDIIDGSYNLTYQAFKKEFLIKKASQSNITWVGDPLNGKLFIRASNYLGRKSLSKYPFEKNSKLANNTLNVPLQVDLVMTEYLVSPKIDFELVLKEADLGSDAKDLETYGFTVINDKDVKIDNTKNSETAGDSQKIVNKEEIKKQAIIMLMFGYFSTYLEGDKIVESFKDVNNFENKAREKASDLITSQLNKYGAGLIKGLDLDFGLQSGLNTANNSRNTNLSVGASKKLANERLIITVGKNFELENKGVKSDQIFDNLQANWVITKDGRYRLNLFRKNRNQMVIEGQVVETGFGFILAFDYDTWKELRKKK